MRRATAFAERSPTRVRVALALTRVTAILLGALRGAGYRLRPDGATEAK